MAEFASLKIKPRPGAYARTADTIEQILNATLLILTSEGYAALTLRRVATQCGLRVGNLTYHFPTKNALVKELLDAVLVAYRERYQRMLEGLDLDDRGQLRAALFDTLRDVQSHQTTHLFPELWSLANHDPEIDERLQDFYRQIISGYQAMIRPLNPDLSEDDAQTLAVFITSFVEGSTIFSGHGKPYASVMPDLVSLAWKVYIEMIETITSEELRALRAAWESAPPETENVPAVLFQRAVRLDRSGADQALGAHGSDSRKP